MADQNKSKTAIKKKLSSPATAQCTEEATEDTTTAKTNKSPPGAKAPTKKSATKDSSLSDTLKGVSTQKIIDEIVEEELKMKLLKRFADLKGLPMESDDLITTLLNKNTPKKKAPAKPKKTPQPKKQANSPSDETEKSAIKSSPTTTTVTPTIPKTNQSPKPTAASKNIETTQVDSSDSSDESESVLPKANIASQVTKKMTPPPTTINKPATTSSSSDSEDEATVEKQKPTPPKPPQQKGGFKLLSTSTKLAKANGSDTSDDEVTVEPNTTNKPLPALPAKTTPPVAKKESSTDSSSSDDEAPPEPVKKQTKPSFTPPNKQITPVASKNTKPADSDTSSSSSDENQLMDTSAPNKKLSFKSEDATKQSSAPAKTKKKNGNDASSDSDSSSDSDEAEAQVGLKPGMKRSGLGANSSTKFSKTEPDADDDESSESVTAYFGKLSYDLDVDGLQNFLKKKGIKYNSVRIITQNDGQSKGFGYVDLPDRAQLAKCVKLNGAELEGMKIKVDEAGARSGGTPVTPRGSQGGQGGFNRSFKNDTPESSNRLKLSNLSYNTTSDKLTSVFPSAVDVFIVKDKETGDSRGFGFVEFPTVDEAKKMMKKYAGKNIDGRDIRLEFAGERPSPGGQRGGHFGGRNSFGNKPFGGGNNYGGNRGPSNARAMKSGAIQEYSGTKKKFGSKRFDDDSD